MDIAAPPRAFSFGCGIIARRMWAMVKNCFVRISRFFFVSMQKRRPSFVRAWGVDICATESMRKRVLDPPVFGVDNLPRTKEVDLAVYWWQNPNHSTCRPIYEPLLPFADDVI